MSDREWICFVKQSWSGDEEYDEGFSSFFLFSIAGKIDVL